MIVFPIESALVKPGDSIFEFLSDALARSKIRLKSRDIVAISSKAIAICENRIRALDGIKPTLKAKRLARKYSLTPQFAQAIVDEADGVLGGVGGALLTIKNGDAVANAGVDRKNAPRDSVVLWPEDPDSTAKTLRAWIRKEFRKSVGVVIVDSRVTPMRLGTSGFAIGLAGFRPVEDLRGRVDLSGRRVEITFQAVADGIAAAAQLGMGEVSERRPFAIIRGAPVMFGSSRGIQTAKLAWNRCLYMSEIMRSNG